MARGKRGAIPAPQLPDPVNVKFSFKHLDLGNEKYSIKKCCVRFFTEMILSLNRYSSFTTEQFREQNNDDGRHCHYFPDTSEPNGFTTLDPETLGIEEAWQIRLCPDVHKPPESAWRVHGVLLGDVFYIVWLDYEHLLYDNNLAPGNE